MIRKSNYISQSALLWYYRIVPNSRALPNKGAPYGLRKAQTGENEQITLKFLIIVRFSIRNHHWKAQNLSISVI